MPAGADIVPDGGNIHFTGDYTSPFDSLINTMYLGQRIDMVYDPLDSFSAPV